MAVPNHLVLNQLLKVSELDFDKFIQLYLVHEALQCRVKTHPNIWGLQSDNHKEVIEYLKGYFCQRNKCHPERYQIV